MSSGIVEEESTDSSPSGDASSLGREFMIFKKLFRDLRLHTDVGLKLYNAKRKEMDERFYDVFYELNVAIDPLEQHQTALAEGASNYDFVASNGTRVRGNGYRSLLHLLKNLMQETVYQLQKSARERGGLFYSPADDLSSVISYVRALQGLETILGHAVQLMENCKPPHLLEDGKMAENLKKMACTGDVARDVFYGRCLGFQYSSSLKPLLQIIAIGMASYDQWYRADKTDPVRRLLQSIWKGSKYLHRPTERGIKIADLTQFCSIPFTRAFWSIPEQESIKTALMNFVGTSVDISENLEVPARNIVLQGLEGKEVTLSPPFSETGYRPIPVTLISHRIRAGQPSRGHGRKQQPLPPSPVLVVHFHGGGFVAQSPRSHEFYLRTWSRDLHCPILSVEYALSPENPFPRALEECVCSYAWALCNLDAMGCTGEKVVLVGDSAGGNLVISIAMKLKQLGLRLPDQIVSFYPTAVMRSSVTPSRFLSLADPLLPVGVLYSCLQAYAGNSPSDEAIAKVKDYRTKVLRARGYIVPQLEEDENKSSPKLTRRLSDPSKLGQPKTLPSSSTDDSKRESAKVPPPRPPPPRSGSLGRILSLDASADGSEPSKPNTTDLPASGTTTGEQEERHSEELVEIALSSPRPGTKAKQPSQSAAQSPPQRPPPPSEESIMSASMARFMIRNEAGGRPKLGMKPPSREEQLSEEEIQRMTEEVMGIYADRESSKDPFMSPGLAPADALRGLPPVHIVVGGLDPLMDDGVILAQHLQAAQQPVTLTVIDNLPHGFLSLTGVEELHVAHAKCLAVIKHALK